MPVEALACVFTCRPPSASRSIHAGSSVLALMQGMLMASSQPATAAALEEQLRGWEADVARLEGAAQQVTTPPCAPPTRWSPELSGLGSGSGSVTP